MRTKKYPLPIISRCAISIVLFFYCFTAGAQAPTRESKRMLDEANNAFNQDNYRLAIRKFNAVKICDPSQAADMDKRVLAVFDKIEKKRIEAEENLRLVIKTREAMVQALRAAQNAKIAANAAESAAIESEKKLQKESDNLKEALKISDNRAKLMDSISQAYKIAVNGRTIQNFEQVEQLWKNVEAHLPNFPEVHIKKTKFLLSYYKTSLGTERKTLQEALEPTFAKGISRTKGFDQINLYKDRADFLDDILRYEESDKDWDIVYRDSSSEAKGLKHLKRATLHNQYGSKLIALQHINKAIEYMPDYAETYIIRSEISINPVPNLSDIEKAIELAKNNEDKAQYYSKQGNYYEKTNQLPLAIEAYSKAIELTQKAEDKGRYYTKQAGYYEKINQLPLAEEAYKKAIELTNDNVLLHQKLADNYKSQNRMVDANKQITEANSKLNYAIEEVKKDYSFTPSSIEKDLEKYWWLHNTGIVPDNKAIKLQPGADAKVAEAYKILEGYGNPNIVVAVIDNGFDLKNPELGKSKVVKQWDFWNESSTLRAGDPSFSHGTPTASIAISPHFGVARSARFMPLSGTGFSTESTENMFNYCIKNGADVVINGWGTIDAAHKLNAEQQAVIGKAAKEGRSGKGCVILFAVGNEGENVINQYAQHPDVIAVASSTSEDEYADYSNRGDNITVCAPSNGGNFPVLAARASWDEGNTDEKGAARWYYADGIDRGPYLQHFGGTTASVSIVGGICALILSANENLTAKEVKQILINTADKIGSPSDYDANGYSKKFGYGRVNAGKAVKMAVNKKH